MAISSQAPQECGEGSTTRAYGPDRIMEPHERAAVRRCSGCKVNLPVENFSSKAFLCRPCARQYLKGYRERNKEKLAALKKRYYDENRADILERKKDYTRAISKRVIALRLKKRREDPRALAKHNHSQALRRAAETQATPIWADRKKIADFYLEALTRSLGGVVKYSVDHIYPLRGDMVCGLHVPDNLRIIPLIENCSKQNRYPTEDIV